MASELHYRGEAAVHAFASRILLRGHNPGRPLFDEGAADDIYVSMRGRKNLIRVQVKSCRIQWHAKKTVSKSSKVSIPASILDMDAPVDIVAVCLWDWKQWFIGVFDGEDMRRLRAANAGSHIVRKPPFSPELHFHPIVDLRSDPKFMFSQADVTPNFAETDGRWDEIFPSRFQLR
jgi:hypothetical protein